ncbi:osmoprotectant transport system ATP-binding protein [Bacillus thermophilus]|uniref:Quaternary amine transport ATP-binding protein n=1 Tax=Siminovitchia thermophila TaxID=1245522 RepID=A0ABS2R8G6_9BACI|nr:ABC transporter ATP-binding protein [Siminovitchia thermophila]MBM7715474.1 osmoprotectant transport system ATP-binding protein [Siminovitchia thermophila]ONK21431.1 glycine/betaine ABC transporter ATP-binding protein [Bacillus sp. VT-16-64]
MIIFENVSKLYSENRKAVDALNLHIHTGEFFVLIGPSGCGKTTTLKMINRLIEVSHGSISINGKNIYDYNIHELRWNIGYVLQQIALFPHMTVGENIAVVPELKKCGKAEVQKRVDELLEMVGLEPKVYRDRKPKELSGGQQQRIGVARAMAADPGIILMDEPFSALDPISREKLQDDILYLQKTIKKTIVFVTHDMKEALKIADRVCMMKDGAVVQVGKPEDIVQNPASDFVRDFVGVHGSAEDAFQLERLMTPTLSEERSLSGSPVSVSASLQETLSKLACHDQLSVERNGTIIGQIDRKAVIRFLAERGGVHG